MASSTPVRARIGAFELDEANARLLRDGQAITLAPRPFALLCALVRHAGSLVSKNQLLDEVWGHSFVSESVLKTAISDVRSALGDDPRQPRYIETVSRRGYRLIAAAAPMPDSVPEGAGSGPDMLPTGPTAFIGRASALSRLRHSWERACAGQRQIVWVAGEPGIGKSALIECFVGGLGDVLRGRGQCVEHYGVGEPFLPLLEALAELCRRDATLPDLLRTVAPAWLVQLPWLCTSDEPERLRRELVGVSPDRMLREMGELLTRVTERRPLVLVTEDLHWSDRATIQLIDYLARQRRSARFMWLASFRLAEVVALDHPLNTLRHELRLHGLCEEIVLDPFSEQEVADCVARQSYSLAEDEAFVRALHQRTNGVPLYVTSVMREVLARREGGGSNMEDASDLVRAAVPEDLASIVDRHIARLTPEQRELLSAAAVCGVEFRVTTVARALDRDAASVDEMCEALTRERLWLAGRHDSEWADLHEPLYAFSHTIFRQVLYERTARLSLTQLHGKVGAALELERAAGAPVAAAELAMHFERGGNAMTALHYFSEAADAALGHLSPAECLDLTGRALGLLGRVREGGERTALQVTLATLRGVAAMHEFGAGEETTAAFRLAYSALASVPHHPMRGPSLLGYGWLLCLRAEYAEAQAVAEHTASLAVETDDPELRLAASTVRGQLHMLLGRPREARMWIERALPALEGRAVDVHSFLADPAVALLGLLSIQLLHIGLIKQGRARLQQAYSRAGEIDQPFARLLAIWFDAMFELRLGGTERVAALADEMRTLVDEFSLAQGRTASRWFRAWADARMGKPLEGYQSIREAYEDNVRLGMLAGASENLGYAAEALLLAGDLVRARAQVDEAMSIVERRGERVYLPQLLLTEAAIALAGGRRDAGEAAIRRAIAESRAQEAQWLELVSLVDLAESGCATATDRAALAALVQELPEAKDTTAVKRAELLLAVQVHG